jgi:isoleucyl-tRNA synthetase
MFHPVSSKVNFPQIEERILRLWQDKNIFARSVAQRQGKPRFVLYDGPPTVNGSPAIHHVLTSAFKDVIPRYKAMKGFYAPRLAGWDTHGLPVELEIEKELGFSGKAQIEEYGVAKFNALCRESVNRYLKEFEDLLERIGYWVDLENAYVTMRNEYIESGWWAIKQMWDKGLIYQGYKVTPHCPRCGTSLSSHEVAQGYQDNIEDPSIYIKFKIIPSSLKGSKARDQLRQLITTSGKPAYFLAWTTTPWTLPGNTALAVAADAEYVAVELEGEYLILASARLGPSGLGEALISGRVDGKDLAGLKYEPLFNPADFGVPVTRMGTPEKTRKRRSSSYPVITGDFVSMEDGTGIVHIAPAYGEVDYVAGQENGLDFVHMVDLQGKIVGHYSFSGKFVKEADPLVLEDLKARGLLFRSETIRHTYPFCWRCEAPLLYYAKQTWYIRTTALKDRLIAGNSEINWYPDYIKYGRFGDWLENNVDWAFSRERYWGTPLPVWHCEACANNDCVGGVEELKKKPGLAGLPEPLDLHRPFVDEVTYQCAKCGGRMQRVPEVIDCWFDSGNMPIAQYHYPFENGTMFQDGRFPADYICEAVDQTRGWFYSLHAISTLLFDRICYKNVICLGHILDAKGEKMSKRKGNVVWPWEIISKYGADALRWYFFTSSPPGNVRRFDEKMVLEVTRRFFLTLWNVYSFFVTYANIDRFTPILSGTQFEPAELDRWILSELNQLIMDVDSALEHYDPTEAGRRIESFVDELSNWYVRRSRRRFWRSENDADKLAAYNTLYQCLVTLSKLLAPFTPFLADELYQNLVLVASPDAPESVHLADFPVADESKIDKRLSADIQLAMRVASLGRAARSQAGIKVRQPLPVNYFGFSSLGPALSSSLERITPQLLDELNVKELKWDSFEKVAALEKEGYVVSSEATINSAINPAIPDQFKAEGMAREVVHRLQTMRRSAGFEIADHIVIHYQGDEHIRKVMTEFAAYVMQETLSEQLLEKAPEPGAFTESHKLGEHKVSLSVKRLD